MPFKESRNAASVLVAPWIESDKEKFAPLAGPWTGR
jgi:hypothetical protein